MLSLIVFLSALPLRTYAATIDITTGEAYYKRLEKSLSGDIDDNDFYKMYTEKINKDAIVDKTLYAYLLDVTGDGVEELFLLYYI